MESSVKEIQNKIDYPFVALPRKICSLEFYRSPQLFIFLSWIFSRVSLEKKPVTFNNKIIQLDAGEFIFGRNICSEETGLSEQSIRTMINSLLLSEIIQKSTTKSTNKFTVYKLFWSHFSETSNQPPAASQQVTSFQPAANQQVTNNQPAANHKQEEEKEREEEERASKQSCCAPSKEKIAFSSLPVDEQQSILALYKKRESTKPIDNPSGWFKQCIKEKWHLNQKSEEISVSEANAEIIRSNKQLALDLLGPHLNENVLVSLKTDFIIVNEKTVIYYWEPAESFKSKIKKLLNSLIMLSNKTSSNN